MFSDWEKLALLNRLISPVIYEIVMREIDKANDAEADAVLDAPLLLNTAWKRFVTSRSALSLSRKRRSAVFRCGMAGMRRKSASGVLLSMKMRFLSADAISSSKITGI